MKSAGEDAIVAWDEIAVTVESLSCCRRADSGSLSSALLRALASAVGQSLEVELFDSLGLSGLGCTSLSDTTVGSASAGRAMKRFAPRARLASLASAMDLLRAAEASHRVGEELLRRALAPSGLLAAVAATPHGVLCAPALPPEALALPPSVDTDRGAAAETTATPIFWLIEGLIEANCEAARCGSLRRVRAFLELCTALGGLPLADRVRAGRSQKQSHPGTTALQLASAGGHAAVAALLREWPDVDHLKEAGGPVASCLGALRCSDEFDNMSTDGQRTRKRDLMRSMLKDAFSIFSSGSAQ